MHTDRDIIAISNRFGRKSQDGRLAQVARIRGGFSGAGIWRLVDAFGERAVRRWPAGYSEERLRWIHHVLHDLPTSIPAAIPLSTRERQSFIRQDGYLWSVEPWLPGEPTYWREPSNEKLVAAVSALAAFHQGTSSKSSRDQPIPAVRDRIDALTMHGRSIDEYSRALEGRSSELAHVCREVLAASCVGVTRWLDRLQEFEFVRVPSIPCIRDLWHDHVLYRGTRISGLIDFGAMRMDSVATDLARLVGSLVGDDCALWQLAIDSYRAKRTLSDSDVRLARVIDGSSQVISGLNWVRWLYVEKRTFEEEALVSDQLQRILTRLVAMRSIDD